MYVDMPFLLLSISKGNRNFPPHQLFTFAVCSFIFCLLFIIHFARNFSSASPARFGILPLVSMNVLALRDHQSTCRLELGGLHYSQRRAEFPSSSTVRVRCLFLNFFVCYSQSMLPGFFHQHHQLVLAFSLWYQ